MITKNRKVMLNWILNPSAFEVMNANSLVSDSRPLGTSVSAVNKMLARAEEMESLLPDVIGTSPKSTTGDWNNALQLYWHNFEVEVPKTGKPLDISMVFDINAAFCQEAIEKLDKSKNLFKVKATKTTAKEGETVDAKAELESEQAVNELSVEEKEEILANYVMKEVEEQEKFRYCRPVNIIDYLTWRFCLVLGSVGNSPDTIKKDSSKTNRDVEVVSTRIAFYIVDENDINKRKEELQKVRENAVNKYYEIVSSKDKSKLDTYFIMFDLITSIADLKVEDKSSFRSALLDVATMNPQKFMDITSAKGIEKQTEVKKLIMASLIRRIPGSSLIVDADDASIVLGSSNDDVVAFLAASINATYANTLRLKLNNMLK
jgi:hypothetical protein